MNTFSIKEAIKYGWNVFKDNKKILLLSALLFLIITNIQSLYNPKEFSVFMIIVPLLFFVLTTFVQIGWYKLLTKVMDGVPTTVTELFKHGSLFFKYLGTVILFVIIVALPLIIGGATSAWFLVMFRSSPLALIGLLLLIALVIVAVYLVFRYFFVLPISVLEDISIGASFKKSAKITKGVELKIFVFSIVAGLLNILGLICFLVGSLVAVPVTTIAYLYIYRKLSQAQAPQVVPSEEPLTPVGI